MSQDDPGTVVSLREIHEDVKAMRIDLARVIDRLDATNARSSDHEDRIRELEQSAARETDIEKHDTRLDALEKKMWTLAGAASVLAVAFPNLQDLVNQFTQ